MQSYGLKKSEDVSIMPLKWQGSRIGLSEALKEQECKKKALKRVAFKLSKATPNFQH